MHWIDWLVVALPMAGVFALAMGVLTYLRHPDFEKRTAPLK